jgi:hypothetical protein
LENNIDKIEWIELSSNPNAIHIMEKNLDKVKWYELIYNSNAIHLIFNIDYEKSKNINLEFKKELISYVFHSLRLQRLANTYDIELIDLVHIY